MNTSKLADIAEITSSIAILVPLIFLVVQMQQNTEAIQAQSRDTTFLGTQDRLAVFINSPDLQLNRYKTGLTDKEKVRLYYALSMIMRAREYNWFQYQNGVLDETSWSAYAEVTRLSLSTPQSRTWWGHARNPSAWYVNWNHLISRPAFAHVINADSTGT